MVCFSRTYSSVLALAAYFLKISSSMAALDPVCLEEIAAVANNTDFDIASLQADKVAFYNQEVTSCVNRASSSPITCNIDYSRFNSDLDAACAAGGGQVFKIETKVTCTLNGGRLTVNTLNESICAGQSCDKNNVEEYNDKVLEETEAQLISAGYDSCESDTEIAGSDGALSGALGIMAHTVFLASAVLSFLLVSL